MSDKHHVYRCEECGRVVEVVEAGRGTLTCCDMPMKHLAENTVDASKEKHVPVATREGSSFHVKVGSVPHPMTAEHLIEWVEVLTEEATCRVELSPGQPPEVKLPATKGAAVIRAYCNLHGLWKTEV